MAEVQIDNVQTISDESQPTVYRKVKDIDWLNIKEDPLAYLRNPENKIGRMKIWDKDSQNLAYADELFLNNPNLTDEDRKVILNEYNADDYEWQSKAIIDARKDGLFDITKLPTSATLEKNKNAIKTFCLETGLYEIPTQEYINSLSGYLERDMNIIQKKTDKPVVVLEIGAGKGVLSWHLQKKFEADGFNSNLIKASDSKSWEDTKESSFPVEKLDYKEAIEKYGSVYNLIIICSWMPPNEDWMPELIKDSSVKEIILIGPTDGTCGGIDTFDDKDGFKQVDIGEKYKFPHQYTHWSRYDGLGPRYEGPQSETISFKRTE